MAGLSAIPQGIYEAAEMDGAGKWKTFFYITLPNLRPVAFTVVILSVLNSFKAFREVYMAVGSYPVRENLTRTPISVSVMKKLSPFWRMY